MTIRKGEPWGQPAVCPDDLLNSWAVNSSGEHVGCACNVWRIPATPKA